MRKLDGQSEYDIRRPGRAPTNSENVVNERIPPKHSATRSLELIRKHPWSKSLRVRNWASGTHPRINRCFTASRLRDRSDLGIGFIPVPEVGTRHLRPWILLTTDLRAVPADADHGVPE
ncbi:hypothetical protein AB0G02_01650 [Actinosynnema sp. NPDC023658]|uniref:hypothetical protein n=1 Tax=Actinosynnema sp. NPDC023658 TaxID=3155465 RepID=UPI003410CBC3